MSGKIQTRLAVVASLAALVAILVPSTLAQGVNGDVYDENILYLHMGGDGDYFASGDMMQTIGQSKCVIGLSGADLASLDGTTGKGAGIKDHSIGVKSGNSQGVPCSRGSVSEVLHFSLGGDLSEKAINQAQMDLELKGNAVVEVVTYFNGVELETFTLRSGSSAMSEAGNQAMSDSESPDADCLSGVSDSGPDSGANDNCRWTIIPGDIFNGMTMEAISGEFSLEGGNDGTPPAEGSEDYGSDTLFFLEDLGSLITCGETEGISEEGVAISGEVTLHSLDLGDGYTTDCGPAGSIAFLSQVQETEGGAELYFIPTKTLGQCDEEEGDSGAPGRYTTEIVVEGQEITVDDGLITSLFAEYSPDPCYYDYEGEWFEFGETRDLLSCLGQPITDPSDPDYDDFWSGASEFSADDLLPGSETACWYFASAEPTSGYWGEGSYFEGTETWRIYFEVDPGFRF